MQRKLLCESRCQLHVSFQVKVLQERVSEAQRFARNEMKESEQKKKEKRKAPTELSDSEETAVLGRRSKLFVKKGKRQRKR